MTLIIRAALAALIALAALLAAPTPASAHIGVNPHVPTAYYKAFDSLAVNIKPGVSSFWETRAAFLEQDSWMGPLPDMFQSDGCPSNPNTACVTYSQINDASEPWIILFDPDGADGTNDTGFVKYNINDVNSPGRHWSCAATAKVWGLHSHTAPGGCTQTNEEGNCILGDTCDTIHVGEPARDALRDAYRRTAERALPLDDDDVNTPATYLYADGTVTTTG